MQRCFQLALKGLGSVSPNPMVGAVIVKDDKIIGEGYHQKYGGNHAEVNAIENVNDQDDLKGATIYVNLEPCSHHGKTPPCANRIVESGISKVVISGSDPSLKVNGKGIEILKNAGIEVVTDVLNPNEEDLNRRFRVFHREKRPYIILKWAQSKDGFMDIKRGEGEKGQFQLSNEASKRLLHKWRSEEMAIMIGSNTAIIDNPSLNVRLVEGKDPLRVVIDLRSRLTSDLKLFNDGIKTLIYSEHLNEGNESVEYVLVNTSKGVLNEVLVDLYRRNIQSVIVEGGQALLTSFLDLDMWDEIRVFEALIELSEGLKAPNINLEPVAVDQVSDNILKIFKRLE